MKKMRNKELDKVRCGYEETIKYFENKERCFQESVKLSRLEEYELSNFLESIPFSTEQFNKFLKGEFKNGRLKFMYREYLESIGK